MNRYTYITRQIGDHRVLIAHVPLKITEDNQCPFNGKFYPRKLFLWMDAYYIEIDKPVWVIYQDEQIRYSTLDKETANAYKKNQKQWYPTAKIRIEFHERETCTGI